MTLIFFGLFVVSFVIAVHAVRRIHVLERTLHETRLSLIDECAYSEQLRAMYRAVRPHTNHAPPPPANPWESRHAH